MTTILLAIIALCAIITAINSAQLKQATIDTERTLKDIKNILILSSNDDQ